MSARDKQLAISALSNLRGDDLERARACFRGFSAEKMQEPHGFSGKTRAQILKGYEDSNAEIDHAVAWVRAQPE